MAAQGKWAFCYKDGIFKMQRFRKAFLYNEFVNGIANRPLLAVAYQGNMQSHEKKELLDSMDQVGAKIFMLPGSAMALGLRATPATAPLAELVKGRTAIIAGNTDIETAKALADFSKKNEDFFVTGALLDQRLLLEHNDFDKLSKLPSREVVYANLISQMSPGAVLQIANPAQYLVALLQAHAGSGGGADGAVDAATKNAADTQQGTS